MDAQAILDLIKANKKSPTEMLEKNIQDGMLPLKSEHIPKYVHDSTAAEVTLEDVKSLDDRSREEKEKIDEEELYSIKNFSI